VHPPERVAEVLGLVAAGWNNLQISRATGIPYSTVRRWRCGELPSSARPREGAGGWHGRSPPCPICQEGSLDEAAYAYLLGLYLGDGHIVRQPRTTVLCIVQDARCPDLIRLAARTLERVRGGRTRAGAVPKTGCVEVCAWWKHWPCLFPQHGPGRKHERAIVLRDWQRALVRRYPRQLLRGLLHSDGCRTVNRVQRRRYAYPRYFFRNRSEDILRIFEETCDAVGIRHRRSRPDTVAVSRRDDVATLDRFVGPKS